MEILELLKLNPHVTDKTIAAATGKSDRQIRRYLRGLVQTGAIVCRTRKVKLQGWSNQRTVEIQER
jgi:transcription initiation factor IIE alpha subunit